MDEIFNSSHSGINTICEMNYFLFPYSALSVPWHFLMSFFLQIISLVMTSNSVMNVYEI